MVSGSSQVTNKEHSRKKKWIELADAGFSQYTSRDDSGILSSGCGAMEWNNICECDKFAQDVFTTPLDTPVDISLCDVENIELNPDSCSEDNATTTHETSQVGVSLDNKFIVNAVLNNILRKYEVKESVGDFKDLYYYNNKDYRKWLKRLTLFCWFLNKPFGPKINLHEMNFVSPTMERLFKKRTCQMRNFMKEVMRLKQSLHKENLVNVHIPSPELQKNDSVGSDKVFICSLSGFSIPYVCFNSRLLNFKKHCSDRRKKMHTALKYLSCFFLKCRNHKKSVDCNDEYSRIKSSSEIVMQDENKVFIALRLYCSQIQNDTFFKLVSTVYEKKDVEWRLENIYFMEKVKLRYMIEYFSSDNFKHKKKLLEDENVDHSFGLNTAFNISEQTLFSEWKEENLELNNETSAKTKVPRREIRQHAFESLVLKENETCDFSRWIDFINRHCCVTDNALYPCNFLGNDLPSKEDNKKNKKQRLPEIEVVPSGPTRIVTIFDDDNLENSEDNDDYSNLIGKTNFDEDEMKFPENTSESDKEIESTEKYRPNFDSRVEFFVGNMNKRPRKYRPQGEFSKTYFERKKISDSFDFIEEFSEKLDASSKRYEIERRLLRRPLNYKASENSSSCYSDDDVISSSSTYNSEGSICEHKSNESILYSLNDLESFSHKETETSSSSEDLNCNLEMSKEWCECSKEPSHLQEVSSESSLSTKALSYMLNQCIKQSSEDEIEITSVSGDTGSVTSLNSESYKTSDVSRFKESSNIKEKDITKQQPSEGIPKHLAHFFQTDHQFNLSYPDNLSHENKNPLTSPNTEQLREHLLVGYPLPSISYNFKIEESKDCLYIETISHLFVTKQFNLSLESNISSVKSQEEVHFPESRILETLFLPYVLRVCRVTLTCPLSLMIMDFFKDVALLDAVILFFMIRTSPNTKILPKDTDIIDMKKVFNEFLDQNNGFTQYLHLPDSTDFLNKMLDHPGTLDINYKGILKPFLRRNNFPPYFPILREVNHNDFLSACAKEILFYSYAYAAPTFMTTLVYETNKTLRDLSPECGYEEPEDDDEFSDDIEWFSSFNPSLEYLEKEERLKNPTGPEIFWMSEILASSSGIQNLMDEQLKTFITFVEVPLISIGLIDIQWSAWEELFHFGKFKMTNLKEAAPYLTESEDESSCDSLDYESELSIDSSASSSIPENKSFQNDFDNFSLPKTYILPQFEFPSAFCSEMKVEKDTKPQMKMEKAHKHSSRQADITFISSEVSNAGFSKTKRWNKEEINNFENEMNYDFEFELDCDFDRIRKFMLHHTILPEDKAKCFLNFNEYNEFEYYVFKNLLFQCCIFNNPRDWYAFAKASDKPLTGPLSKTFKKVYEIKPEPIILTNECFSLPLRLYPTNKNASIKCIKMILKGLEEEFLKMILREIVASDKVQAREAEKTIILERKGDEDMARKIARDSLRSSSDILHLIKKPEAQLLSRRSRKEQKSQYVGKWFKDKDDPSELIHFKEHECESSSDSSSLTTFNNPFRTNLSKGSSVLSFDHPSTSQSCGILRSGSFNGSTSSADSLECSACVDCEIESSKEDGSSLNTFWTFDPKICDNGQKQYSSYNYPEPNKIMLTKQEQEKDVLHFSIRQCKFSVASAYGKFYEKNAFPPLLKLVDAWNCRQGALESLVPNWTSYKHIVKHGVDFNFPFIDKLHGCYHVSSDDLLRPEHDLRPYNETYGAGHRHWLSLDLFFDPWLHDVRADRRTGKDLLEDRFDGEGSEFCIPGVAWLPVTAPGMSFRDVFTRMEKVECQWQRVMVYDYLEKEQAYITLPVSLEYGPRLVTRPYLVFLFENSDLAADRIYKAVTDRAIAEKQLRSFMLLNFSEPFLANEESLLLSENLLPDCEFEIEMPLKLKKNSMIIYPKPVKSNIELKSSSSDTRTLEYHRPGKNKRITNKMLIDLFKQNRHLNSTKHSWNINLLKSQRKIFGQDFIRKKNIHMVRSLLKAQGDNAPDLLDKSKKKKRKLKRPPPKQFFKLRKFVKCGSRKWRLQNYSEIIADQKEILSRSALSKTIAPTHPLKISNKKERELGCKEQTFSQDNVRGSLPKLFQNRKDYHIEVPLLNSIYLRTTKRGFKKRLDREAGMQQQAVIGKNEDLAQGEIQPITDVNFSKMEPHEASSASSKTSYHLKYKYVGHDNIPQEEHEVYEVKGSDLIKTEPWKSCVIPDRSSWWESKTFRHRRKKKEKTHISKPSWSSSSSFSDDIIFLNPLVGPNLEIIFSDFITNTELQKLNWSKTLDPKKYESMEEMPVIKGTVKPVKEKSSRLSIDTQNLIAKGKETLHTNISPYKKSSTTTLHEKHSQMKHLPGKCANEESGVSIIRDEEVYKTFKKHYFLRNKNKNLRDINYDITLTIKRLMKKGSSISLTTEEIVKGTEVLVRVKPYRGHDIPNILSYKKLVYDWFNPPPSFSEQSLEGSLTCVHDKKENDKVKELIRAFCFKGRPIVRKNVSGSNSSSYEMLAYDGVKLGNKTFGAGSDHSLSKIKKFKEIEANVTSNKCSEGIPSKMSSISKELYKKTMLSSSRSSCSSKKYSTSCKQSESKQKIEKKKIHLSPLCSEEISINSQSMVVYFDDQNCKESGLSTSSFEKIKFDGMNSTNKNVNTGSNKLKHKKENSNICADGSLSKMSSVSNEVSSPPSSKNSSLKEYFIPSKLSSITLHSEHLFNNKYHGPDVLPYVVETLKEIRKSILREFPSQYYKIPSPLERLDLLCDLVDELADSQGCTYGAKEQLILEFLRGYVSIFDKSCIAPSVVAKFIGDFEKSAYASYYSRALVDDKVKKEGSRVKGIALLHYIILNERMQKSSILHVNDWDLELLPNSLRTVKRYLQGSKIKTLELQSPVPISHDVVKKKSIKLNKNSYDFAKSNIHELCLYIRPDMYSLYEAHRLACLHIMNIRVIYTPAIKKCRNLSSFIDALSEHTNNVMTELFYIRNVMLNNIKAFLDKHNNDSYMKYYRKNEFISRLKSVKLVRFFTFLLSEALRTCMGESLKQIVYVVETVMGKMAEIEDDYEWGPDLNSKRFQGSIYHPFFKIKMFLDGNPHVCENLSIYEEKIIDAFWTPLEIMVQIGPLNPMPAIPELWPRNYMIRSYGLQEKAIVIGMKRIKKLLHKNIVALNAYLKAYQEDAEVWNLNAFEYAREFVLNNKDAEIIVSEIKFHRSEANKVLVRIPSNIVIGMFEISTRWIADFLREKRLKVADYIAQFFTLSIIEATTYFRKRFTEIYLLMLKTPMEIDELLATEQKVHEEFKNSQKLMVELRQLQVKYELLHEIQVVLEENEVNEFGEVLTWPGRINTRYNYATHFSLPKMKYVLIECQKYFEDKFVEELDAVALDLHKLIKETDIKQVKEANVAVADIQTKLDKCIETARLFKTRRELFGLRPREFTQISQMTKIFEPYKTLWTNVLEWRTTKDSWLFNEVGKTNPDVQESKFNEFYRLASRSIRDFKSYPELQDIANTIRDEMDNFRFFMEIFRHLHAPLKDRHWDVIQAEKGVDLHNVLGLTFMECLDRGVLKILNTLEEWSENANREYAIECGLNKIMKEWDEVNIHVLYNNRNFQFYTFKVSDDELQLIDDHKSLLLQLLYSPFRGIFEKDLLTWEKKLRIASSTIYKLLECQKILLYLEPIFWNPDIRLQLPAETALFVGALSYWSFFTTEARMKEKFMPFAGTERLLRKADNCLDKFHSAMQGLNKYLEGKRQGFPRFYFLSDEELVDTLSQAKNPLAVQPHLRKCFENIYKLNFKKDLKIVAMASQEGETVKLAPSMYPGGVLEDWLNKLEAIMKQTVRVNAYHALVALAHTDRTKWILQWPGQVVIAASQTIWTARIERGFERNKLKPYFQKYLLMLNGLRTVIRGELTKVQREVVSSLIVIEVHARDVFENLCHINATDSTDFAWICNLRYYWLNRDLKVKSLKAVFKYGYEYLGNSGRLVITPLTDRCYLTLTGALNLKFGGAPAGPAGTGKTETTKDLAKALAIQCVVFNCSDQLDYKAMGKFFKGLAGSGAWACFDEFNRIDIEVLSVVAQQITTIQKAQFAEVNMFMFEGAWIKMKTSCAVFITMNPGYAGRTELPDNLKALFRPVAMMVPDYTLIAEISLFSFGFSDSKKLAGKITTTFKLSSEQLSTQDHYDFGMRAVKTVISVAGNLKREHPKMDERQIVLRALKDVNVPKFLSEDLKLFTGIVSDLFPRMQAEAINYGSFQKSIKRIIFKDFKLQPVDGYVHKVIQLYETTVVRHGLMLVGPAGSGKTKCYQILQKTMTYCTGQKTPAGGVFSRVLTFVLNPKSITMAQLYGEVDINTLEWSDGILPFYARKGANAKNNYKRWYVFDGPVDAVWIENMNTVLDDNKKLCMTSGEVIKMTEHMTMVFEVADLAVASPATVSRCGMVYIEPGVLGLYPLIDAWIRRLPRMAKSFSNRFRILLKRYTLNGLKFMRKNLNEYVPSVDINILQSCFRLLNLFIRPIKLRDTGRKPSNSLLFQIKICLTGWIVFSTLWSVGATCDERSRNKFSDYLKYKIQKHHAYPRNPKRSLYDYNFTDGGFSDVQKRSFKLPRWVSWTSNVGEYVIKSDVNYCDIEVPTIDNIRSANLVGRLLEGFHDVLCVGPTGTGKSVTIMSKLTRSMPKDFVVDFMTFSARTSSRQTQEVIEAKLDKLKKYIRGAPRGKIQILFIDDFNMPALETYGAQPPLELIRQLMDFGGWYSLLEVGQFLKIADVNLVAAMGPPGGGRNPVSARTLRHFHYISFPDISYVSKKMIFGTILLSWLERTLMPDKYAFGLKALVLTLDTYSTIERELLPTPAKTHYTFNLRDLSKIFQGILMTKPETYDSVGEFLILWFHEHCRVYGDRLINDIDNEWFEQMLVRKVEFYLTSDLAYTTGEHRRDSHTGKYHYTKRNIFFGDFLAPVDDKCYEKITDLERLESVIEVYLYAYNMTSKNPMDLVLFEDALSHVCKVARIIRQPLGNALLLGLAGSGRQSVTRLAAAAMEYSSFQIELTRSYSMNDWREDLKKMMMGAGIYKKETVFLFSDSQVKYEEFLEDLNNVLNSGDVPNIYELEDKDLIMGAVRNEAMELGITPTYPNLFSYYLKQIKARLHTVVTMSPIGELFRARLRQFPALVNCCTIDWFSDWPEDALRRVGTYFIERATWALKMPVFLVDRVVESCIFIHRNVVRNKEWYLKECARQVYITPSHFLGFLKTFVYLCEQKVETNYTEITRLTEGIKKLTQTEDEMAELQELILRSEPELIRQGERALKMLEYIEESKASALVKSQTIKKSEQEIAEMMKVCAEIEREAQLKLELAMPDLKEAEAELETLNKNDLSELKSLSKPPPGVKLTMEAVCVLLSVKPVLVVVEGGLGTKTIDYWIPAQRLLAEPGKFLQTLFNFRIDKVPQVVIQRLKKYITDPEFEPEKIEKASFACMSLCKWIYASVKYYYVHKDVAPKIKALKDAKKLARKMTAQLNQARRMMNNINRSILQLEEELENTHLKQKQIEQNIEYSKKRQKKAKRLVKSLGNEKDQWTEKKMKLLFITRFFFGDFLIGSGLIAYLGPFTSKYRNQMIEYWYCVLLGKNTPFIYREKEYIKGFCTSFQIENWIINGLPRDSFSVENGVIVQCSRRWPFFIDPQKQAYKWLKKMYKDNIVIIKMDDNNFKDYLSGAIINGLVLLVESNTCELDTSLDPVLLKQTFFQRGQTLIKLADLILPYHDNFRFYVTTTSPNPALTPEVYIKLTVINFTLSAVGLQEQLIGLTVQNEIPGLERYKIRLIESVAKLKEQIRSLQDLILQLIRETVSPVDDGRLKETLQISRIITRKSRIKISAANKAKKVLDEVRVKYSIIAIRGQLLFFCVSEMAVVDPMYQYSLDWFIDIFNKTLVTTSKQEEEVEETPALVEEEEVGEEVGEEELIEETTYKSSSSVDFDLGDMSFIDYNPSSPEGSDVSASEFDFQKISKSSSEQSVSFYEPEELSTSKGDRKGTKSKSLSRVSRKSTYYSEKVSKHTTLLWEDQKKIGRKKPKNKSLYAIKGSVRSSIKSLGKKSIKHKELTKKRLKQLRQKLILRTIRRDAKSKEGTDQKHCLKVDKIMVGRRKGLLELKAELKIIHLQRKLLISRQKKKIELEDQFRKKIKRMYQQAMETSGDPFGETKEERSTFIKLLRTSNGRNKLRERLKTIESPRKISEFKESDYSVRERCKTVSTELTINVYSNVCRSLFEKHKVLLAFLLSIRLMKANRRVDSSDWNFFLAGDVPKMDLPLPEDATWMTERIWKDVLSLENLKSFKPFVKHFIENYRLYKNIVDARNPHKEPLPAPWSRFTIVKRLLVLKCLRYDRLIDAMYDFIDKSFGHKFIEPQVTDLSAMYGDSSPGIPLVFILSQGTDPADDLYKFARKYSMTSKFHSISLGQGQGVIAEGMFKEAVIKGHWVFFQNCHLAPSWMPRLEALIESVDPDFTNKNFRVWLTSLPSPSFPVGVLQKSSKITMEPPRGIKANLLRSYTGVVSEFKDIINNTESHKAQLFRDLLFALCLFHSVILERRKYGSLGFNNTYEFTDGDLRICISQLRLFLDLFDHVPYEVLRHTAGEINYGGRVTDDWDRRCINHLLEDYYNVKALKFIPFDSLRWYIKQPYGTSYENYINYIKKIPSIDYPQLVGLHDNASINYAFKETNLCFEVLLNLHPGVGAGDSEKDKEKILTEKVSSLRETIPSYYDELAIMDIKKRFPVMYKESLNTVLVQEVLRYNNLLKVIHRSLFDLTRAISGTVVMSEALERMYRNILSNRVPEMWTAKAYPSLKTLAPWVADLKKRLAFIESWQLQQKLPEYWISGLYFPQAFLTGCLQNHARKYLLPIDTLSFKFEVMPMKKFKNSTLIYGLFMEGATWNNKKAVIWESLPKVLYTEMPKIALIPEQHHEKPPLSYICPVYKTLLRAGTLSTTGHSTNFILAIEVPSLHNEHFWIKRSVAMFTAVEE